MLQGIDRVRRRRFPLTRVHVWNLFLRCAIEVEVLEVNSGQRPQLLQLGMGWASVQAGGLNRYFAGLISGLERAGIRSTAVVLGPLIMPTERVIVPADAGDPILLRIWRYHRAVKRLIEGVDVVDSHFALYSAIPVMLGVLRNKPLIVHFQGPWADESKGAHINAKVILKRWLELTVYRRAARFIVLSAAFKRVLVERYGVEPWRISIMPPAVELEKFSPGESEQARARLGVSPKAWLAVSVRRLVPRMGLNLLLEAWREVVTVDPGAILAIIGEGPSRKSLEKRAAELGLRGAVHFTGQVDDASLVEWYRAANVSVIPSLQLEGFGLVTLESLACGTPAIGTAVGGIPEALSPLDSSLVVRDASKSGLSKRLRDAMTGAQPLPGPEQCRSYAEKFSWAEIVHRTVDVYREAINLGSPRKPRVVYLDHCAQLSGAELALARLLPALSRVDAHVILGESGPLVGRLQQDGVSVEVLPMPGPARLVKRNQATPRGLPVVPALGTAWYVLRLARRLRRLKPDIVHTNSLKAAIYGGLATRLAGIPCVWHVRDRIAPDYLPESAVRFIRWMTPRVASAVIANSRTTLASLNLSRSLASVIRSPVVFDPVTIPSDPCKNGHKTFVIGMVGRLAPWKGQHVFIEAFAKAFPAGSEQGVIIGAALFGEDSYASGVLKQAAELGLNGRMKFLGFREDVPSLLAQCDVLVHASVIPEPFGQVVIEGMAAGLPVVACRAGGPAEVVKDGVTGLLYEPGDVDALAESLRRLADDEDLRKRLGAAARKRARDFSPETIAAQVFDLYRTVLEGTPKAPPLILD